MEINIKTLMYGNKEKLDLLLGRDYPQKIKLNETDEIFSKLYAIGKNILEKRGSGVKIKTEIYTTLINGDKKAIIRESYFSKSVFFREGNCIIHYLETYNGTEIIIGYNNDLGYNSLYEASQRVKSKEFSDIVAAIYNKQ